MKKAIISILVFSVVLSCTLFGAKAGNLTGDVNGDNQINSSDALYVLQISTGQKTATEKQQELADVNGDKKVNSNDALVILQYSVGLKNDEEEPTTTKKILYYYEDGTTGYEPKPGAKYEFAPGVWVVVPGDSLTDEELKEWGDNCPTGKWQ